MDENTGTQVADDAGSQAGVEGNPKVVPVDPTPAAEGNQNEVAGLKAAAAAERDKRQVAEKEAETLRGQMAIAAGNQPQAQPQVQESLYEQVAKHLGYDLEYPLSVQEHGRVTDAMMQMQNARQAENVFMASHPDYDKVVGTTDGQNNFHPAPPLKAYFERNPGSQQEFYALGSNPAMKRLAYRVVTTDPDYKAAQKEAGLTDEQKKAAEAQAKIKAANTPVSISSVPGGGNLDRAAEVAGWTDAQVAANVEAAKNSA